MTYCVALKLEKGLVLVSDSRTNAGVDHISSFKKLHKFEVPGERSIYLQCAGNLATTQSIVSKLDQAIRKENKHILNVSSLFEAAELIGNTVRSVIERDSGPNQGIDFSCNILLSGQIMGEEPRLFHIYPQGNFIEAGSETPYFQIGESKYGKPILDRVIHHQLPLDRALQCALISMDSTLRSNLSVGMPLHAAVYETDSFDSNREYVVDEEHEAFRSLQKAWSKGMKELFEALPIFVEQ